MSFLQPSGDLKSIFTGPANKTEHCQEPGGKEAAMWPKSEGLITGSASRARERSGGAGRRSFCKPAIHSTTPFSLRQQLLAHGAEPEGICDPGCGGTALPPRSGPSQGTIG